MADAATAPKRIVPGAPPPPPLTKSQQKKKRKTGKGNSKEDSPSVDAILDLPSVRASALISAAPSEEQLANGVASGLVEPALVATREDKQELTATSSAEPKKPTASVEAVAKKLRALGKKVVRRITRYAHCYPG